MVWFFMKYEDSFLYRLGDFVTGLLAALGQTFSFFA